ncbi:MAG TPA: hypothetical protein VG206_04155 [Terriglobia bacterium]|nr:hypothetical protein [Terriglobia bacterium]
MLLWLSVIAYNLEPVAVDRFATAVGELVPDQLAATAGENGRLVKHVILLAPA